jgi:uncharacterized membrane protein|tara:strand:- start:1106 stop:1786 length:681 start_codon:yes stop_codon:yes gene_type:complete
MLLVINFVSAQYVTGDIYLQENGKARFSLDTNADINIEGLKFDIEDNKIEGTTELLTRKEKGVWSFVLKSRDYETILIDIHLPYNLIRINSLEGNDHILDVRKGIVSLIDNDKELNFEVHYQLEIEEDYSLFWLMLVIMVLVVIFSYLLFMKKRNNKSRLDYILPIINDNEKKIVELLMKGNMRQKDIRKKLEMPKASFSRYIINLERKKLVIRMGEGKNKMVKLK